MNIINIKSGICYLVKEIEPELSIELFKAAINKGFIGLIISKEPPKEIMKKVQVDNITIIWLSNIKGENNIPITDLVGLRYKLSKFIQHNPKCIILNLAVAHLIDHNGFKEILNLIYSFQDDIWVSEACLITSINPNTINVQELNLIGQYMKIIEAMDRSFRVDTNK
jgi:hypothetical protein